MYDTSSSVHSVRINVSIFIVIFFISLYGCGREPISPDANDTIPPLPPSGLSILSAQDGYIDLVWIKNIERDLSAYIVYRSDGNQNAFHAIDTTQNLYYVDEHRSYDSSYYYYITAIDQSNNQSQPSAIATSKSPNVNPPDSPMNFFVYGHNSAHGMYMQLEWQPNTESDLSGYRIYRSEQPNVSADAKYLIATTDRAFLLDSSITKSNNVYYYVITAVDRGAKESPVTQIASDLATEIPQLLSPLPFGSVSVNVSFQWNRAGGAQRYQVIVSTSAFTNDQSSWYVDPSGMATESSTYQGASLAIGQIYYWRIVTFSN